MKIIIFIILNFIQKIKGQIKYGIDILNSLSFNLKIFLEEKCAKIHEENLKNILLNENIFNFCTEHKSRFYVRCIKCNKSLCQFCNLNEHDIIEESHHSTFLSDLRLKKMILIKLNLYLKSKKYFLKR